MAGNIGNYVKRNIEKLSSNLIQEINNPRYTDVLVRALILKAKVLKYFQDALEKCKGILAQKITKGGKAADTVITQLRKVVSKKTTGDIWDNIKIREAVSRNGNFFLKIMTGTNNALKLALLSFNVKDYFYARITEDLAESAGVDPEMYSYLSFLRALHSCITDVSSQEEGVRKIIRIKKEALAEIALIEAEEIKERNRANAQKKNAANQRQ